MILKKSLLRMQKNYSTSEALTVFLSPRRPAPKVGMVEEVPIMQMKKHNNEILETCPSG